MKNLKKFATITLCATLAGTMTAGASYVQVGKIAVSKPSLGTQCDIPQSLSQFLQQIGIHTQPIVIPPNINLPDCDIPDDSTPIVPPDTDIPDENLPDNGDQEASSFATEVVRLVNEERAKQGLTALTLHKQVQEAAQTRAIEQAQQFSHTRPDGTSYSTALQQAGVSYRTSGENIAYGQKTPQQVVMSWMNSAGHRANILNSNYTAIGVGYAQINGQSYWAQLFIG